jgi:hypothetical protein
MLKNDIHKTRRHNIQKTTALGNFESDNKQYLAFEHRRNACISNTQTLAQAIYTGRKRNIGNFVLLLLRSA